MIGKPSLAAAIKYMGLRDIATMGKGVAYDMAYHARSFYKGYSPMAAPIGMRMAKAAGKSFISPGFSVQGAARAGMVGAAGYGGYRATFGRRRRY